MNNTKPAADTPTETDDRGPEAEKVELEKRLDRNAELEDQAKTPSPGDEKSARDS